MIAPHYTFGKILIAVSMPLVAEIMALSLDQTTINSLALLGVAVIGLYTANKSAAIKKDVSAVHTLSNSAMGAQLKLNVQFAEAVAVLTRRLADQSKEAGDIAAATAADVQVKEQSSLYQEHLVKQAKVDAERK